MSVKTYDNKKSKFYIQWHITEVCNLKCKHCYVNKNNYELSFEEITKGINNVLVPVGNWVDGIDICLSGGEPFLYPYLEELLLYLKSYKKINKIMFTTNGTIINTNLLKKHKEFIGNIQISLEGSPKNNDIIRGKGVYKIIEKNVKLLKGMGFEISINMTINKINIGDIDSVISFCLKNNVDYFAVTRMIPIGEDNSIKNFLLSNEELLKVYQKLKFASEKYKGLKISFGEPLWQSFDNDIGIPCSVGLNGIAILTDGTIYPCRKLDISIGNFLNDNFTEMWFKSSVLNQIRQNKCIGCRAMAYALSGNYLAKDPNL
ncbi:MAG: radical SAM protein [Candidatus Absconditabacteria bacterium]